MSSTRPNARRNVLHSGFIDSSNAIFGSDDEADQPASAPQRKGLVKLPLRKKAVTDDDYKDTQHADQEDNDVFESPASSTRRPWRQSTRLTLHDEIFDDFSEVAEGGDSAYYDTPVRKNKRGRRNLDDDEEDDFLPSAKGSRHSKRTTRHQGSFREPTLGQIYRSEDDTPSRDAGSITPKKARVVNAREIFQPRLLDDPFRTVHRQQCQSCGEGDGNGHLIYCQGCSFSYHQDCLGPRSGRLHLVTKVAEDDFVLQCQYCVGKSRSKDMDAPRSMMCKVCKEDGTSCAAFKPFTTPLQDQRAREDNQGVDPIFVVDGLKVHQSGNVLFRCFRCFRAWHYEHQEYDSQPPALRTDWRCKECVAAPADVESLVAWRPTVEMSEEDNYNTFNVDTRDYLVKWKGLSYYRVTWMPGAWVWSIAYKSTIKAFLKSGKAEHPKKTAAEAVPEDYLRPDIVLDIRLHNGVPFDAVGMSHVHAALIKFEGLTNEDATWELPPPREQQARFKDFCRAYMEYIIGSNLRAFDPATYHQRRVLSSATPWDQIQLTQQPPRVTGGRLLPYQLAGVNWLLQRWHTGQSSILGDEMGLGKTIQIIALLVHVADQWGCFPFLIVVPNSTVPNWRREIKRWVPRIRVVTYFGSAGSRETTRAYELDRRDAPGLRCHMLITSYETITQASEEAFFRNNNWQILVLDEGQAVKNDQSRRHKMLQSLNIPHKILLTGTPLQNNARELINLLGFLDPRYSGEAMAARYKNLDAEKIAELQNMLKPFMLRRTKAEVLDLPPVVETIIPVSMTVLQKRVYKSILEKDVELLRAIMSANPNPGATKNLNHVLIRLRQCLGHPFIYSQDIEEKEFDSATTHRNLIDAAAKLKLLEAMLPRLRERGHRVLIFSQFLDVLNILEDFLTGEDFLYKRLDGNVDSLRRQHDIDEFNAPNSQYFAFLLSTRAGGVGINLASADTVIIFDPDYNPQQDLQSISRAHRIGQGKVVQCFRLVTRGSAEEQIMRIGQQKLALSHAVITNAEAGISAPTELMSILQHGAAELFSDNDEKEIIYDSVAIDALLDSNIAAAESAATEKRGPQFSVAKVYNIHDRQQMALDTEIEAPSPGVWDKILNAREKAAKANAKKEVLGKGRRNRGNAVKYSGHRDIDDVIGIETLQLGQKKKKKGKDSDDEFAADDRESSDGGESEGAPE